MPPLHLPGLHSAKDSTSTGTMRNESTNPLLKCSSPGCKSTTFASTQNLARHTTAKHGEKAVMLCGKKLQNVRHNYQRHLFETCDECKATLRRLGGQNLRAKFKDTSLETLRRKHQEMVQRSSPPTAQRLSEPATVNKLEVVHEESKPSHNSMIPAAQAPYDRHYDIATLGYYAEPLGKPSSSLGCLEPAAPVESLKARLKNCPEDDSHTKVFSNYRFPRRELVPSPNPVNVVVSSGRDLVDAEPTYFGHYAEGEMPLNIQQNTLESSYFDDAMQSILAGSMDCFNSSAAGWSQDASDQVEF